MLVEAKGYYQVSLFTTLHLTRPLTEPGLTDWLDWLGFSCLSVPSAEVAGATTLMRVLGICTGLPFLVLSIFYSLSHPSVQQTSSSMNICPVTWNCSGWGLGFYDSGSPLPRSMEGVVMISILHQNQAVRTRCILGSEVSQKRHRETFTECIPSL